MSEAGEVEEYIDHLLFLLHGTCTCALVTVLFYLSAHPPVAPPPSTDSELTISFLFLFHSFVIVCSLHRTALHTTTPLLRLLVFPPFPSLTAFYSTLNLISSPFCGTLLFSLLLFTFSLLHRLLLLFPFSPVVGLPSPLVSRRERQRVPADSSDQSRAAGLPSHC